MPASPEAKAAQAYRLYVLARAGKGLPGAARVLAEDLDQLPTPLAKAQLGAALMLAHDQPRAEAAFAAALDAPARKWWYKDYGTALRDQLATVVLLKESGVLPRAAGRTDSRFTRRRPATRLAFHPGSSLGGRRSGSAWQGWPTGPDPHGRQRASASGDDHLRAEWSGHRAQSR